ncbi:MAG: phage terminase large subunit [Candidatus Gygaella obscura]|nr:phage terminase large subunit [Candidatus Gygaella obscura]
MNKKILKDASALRRKTAESSLYTFAQLYMSKHISIKPSEAHRDIYKMLSEVTIDRGKKIVIAAPRDFGKSTMITLVYIVYLICYSKEQFIVIISNTASQAEKILDNVRSELTENDALHQDFPDIFEDSNRVKPPRWTRNDVTTRNHIEILALGYGQQIRGRKHMNYRPSLIILDDLESGENTYSSETKEKMQIWLERSVLKAGSNLSNFIFIGTVHNSFSLLGEYLNSEHHPAWIGRKYKVVQEWPKNMYLWEKCWKIRIGKELYNGKKGESAAKRYYQDNKVVMDEGAVILWPEKWDLYKLMDMNAENEFSFSSEMQNEPVDTDKLSFDVDKFTYWSDQYLSVDALLRDLGDDVSFYGACDPALGGGDYSAIIVIAKQKDDYYIIVSDIAHKDQDKLIRDILAYAKRYHFSDFVVEANNFQELLVAALEKEAMDQKISINLTGLKNSGPKQKRIMELYSWIKNGSIKFCRSDKLLLDQFSGFPLCKHDDGPDALEMAMKACYGQSEGGTEIYSTKKEDFCSGSGYFDGWDTGDRDFLEINDDDDGPSPHGKEIKFL